MSYRMLPLFAALLATSMTAEVQAAAKQFLWVTNAYGNDVHVVDVSTHRVIKRVEVGPNPHGIAAPDDAHVIYIAIENFKSPVGELLWVNPRTYKVEHRLPIGSKPNQLACTPDGRWVYVPCNDGKYWVIDGLHRKVVKKISTGGPQARINAPSDAGDDSFGRVGTRCACEPADASSLPVDKNRKPFKNPCANIWKIATINAPRPHVMIMKPIWLIVE